MAPSSTDLDLAPLNAFTSSPPTYSWMVGSPSTWLLAGVTGLVLVSILTKVTLSPWVLASSSMIGATCLHGPHQSAQKSTSTGLSDLITTSSKVESVTSDTAPIENSCSLLGPSGNGKIKKSWWNSSWRRALTRSSVVDSA